MTARIYRPARNAMQSGTAKTRRWRLDFEPEQPRAIDPLMGWTSSSDMKSQLRLVFDSKEEAIAYAQKNGVAYTLEDEAAAQPRKGLSYSDNFRFNRIGQWTH